MYALFTNASNELKANTYLGTDSNENLVVEVLWVRFSGVLASGFYAPAIAWLLRQSGSIMA